MLTMLTRKESDFVLLRPLQSISERALQDIEVGVTECDVDYDVKNVPDHR